MLFNEPKLLKSVRLARRAIATLRFSALQRAEIAEILGARGAVELTTEVSVLFNEPKLLKCCGARGGGVRYLRFSALQRAEIAEIFVGRWTLKKKGCFSALQRAEIAEIGCGKRSLLRSKRVSVLFNEPKLLKY